MATGLLLGTMMRNGLPPYDDVLAYEALLTHEHVWNVYPMVPGYLEKGEMPGNLLVDEYDLVQKVRGMASLMDTYSMIYPQLRDLDRRTRAARLQVPVHVVVGVQEVCGRTGPAREWDDALDAPAKQWIELPQSGHRPRNEQPAARFAEVTPTVLSETRSEPVR